MFSEIPASLWYDSRMLFFVLYRKCCPVTSPVKQIFCNISCTVACNISYNSPPDYKIMLQEILQENCFTGDVTWNLQSLVTSPVKRIMPVHHNYKCNVVYVITNSKGVIFVLKGDISRLNDRNTGGVSGINFWNQLSGKILGGVSKEGISNYYIPLKLSHS